MIKSISKLFDDIDYLLYTQKKNKILCWIWGDFRKHSLVIDTIHTDITTFITIRINTQRILKYKSNDKLFNKLILKSKLIDKLFNELNDNFINEIAIKNKLLLWRNIKKEFFEIQSTTDIRSNNYISIWIKRILEK